MKTMFGRASFAQARREPNKKAKGARAKEASVCLRVRGREGLIHLSRCEPSFCHEQRAGRSGTSIFIVAQAARDAAKQTHAVLTRVLGSCRGDGVINECR